MSARFGLRHLALLAASTVGALTIAGTAAHADSDTDEKILLKGSTTASYFWDDSSGRAGDTGLPASGKPMQKQLAASPSWPLLTEGYVMYQGKKMPFFVGDRGPGAPSNRGIMLDLDAKTFADLTGGTFNPDTLGVDGVGGEGHIKVDYVITKWGEGVGKKNHPVAFSTGAWSERDENPAEPPKVLAEEKPSQEPAPQGGGRAVAAPAPEGEPQESGIVGGALMAGALAMAGGGMVLGGERLRTLVKR
ncbi:hypothetical protein SAMN05444920_10844 [Nonomuraea solani]|uniref:Htaa protein n=1 Tax=Nonomuraea solani TaxID=1144553 RepID=A0A1H6E862_9ACTN|nr:hypothetical protein [Nonomuraea solani]SEG93136.1 hypothetical protein SAMN05444920_10844 [Nonomuraea solani]